MTIRRVIWSFLESTGRLLAALKTTLLKSVCIFLTFVTTDIGYLPNLTGLPYKDFVEAVVLLSLGTAVFYRKT